MPSNRKHPAALPYLFLSEMWERFGFYLLLGILWLFLVDTEKGGWGMDNAKAVDIYGTYLAFVYLTPFVGGLLADRVLGYGKSIIIGGILMGIGYIGLAVHNEIVFYLSLALLCLGNGLFKPNISTLLGNTYNKPEFKANKDAGYNIFYFGINIGAFICNFFAAYLRNSIGWGAAFIAAGIGMFLGVIIFVLGKKHYKEADVLKPTQPTDMPMSQILSQVFIPALVAGVIGWIIPGTILGSDSTDAFLFACIPIIYFFVNLLRKAAPAEKPPLKALLTVFAVSALFWSVFKQNGSALTTWAQYYTDREIPAAIEGPVSSLKLAQTVTNTEKEVTVYDKEFRVVKDADGKPVKEIGLDPYFKNLQAEKMPPKDASISLVNTELFQSINPFFVLTLTPLVVGFFALLRRRGKEPSTPSKIAYGLLISALSTFMMIAAVYYCHNGEIKASPWWLVGCYGVITLGELFLSPMGLSLVSKLSPPRITALMMGGWFLSISMGNKLSGVLATLWDKYDNKANYFLVNFALLGIAALGIFLMLRWLNRIFKEYSH
ncbi:POT family proton-dependent oligopeptide transporter [Chitinophaga skermanii]|uniref:POT family proton-dependent oligopeptide transporter n=1 Tax=Chitinophaga skermanii TaxID=331697 RepID=A0A327Q2Z2_9BACT|nr:peptide MFS transporter [Chitinophaga skermanii]RAI98729.1 POT family proton-dependent oligopeptide transporter [Chitinophaga skermanii]